jgi:cAMP-dependent protein kinase regulator
MHLKINFIVKDSAIQNRTKYENFLSKVDVLQSLDTYERNKLCDCLTIQNYPKDSYVIKQGDKGDTFYMIMKGEGQALKENKKTGAEDVVYEYKENMYFGELSLLKEQPRAASIKTTVSF